MLTDTAWKRLRELGVDAKALVECIDELCPDVPKEHIPGLESEETQAMKTSKAAKANKGTKPQTVADVKFAKAVAPKPAPVVKPPKKKTVGIKEIRQPTFPTMFTRLDLEEEEKRVADDKGGKGGTGGGHGH